MEDNEINIMELYRKVHSFEESTVCIQILMFFILRFDNNTLQSFMICDMHLTELFAIQKKCWLEIKVRECNTEKLYAVNSW